MSPALSDVPFALALVAAAALGGLQAGAYALARVGVADIDAVAGTPAAVLAIFLVFAAGAGAAGGMAAFGTADPTAAALGAPVLALGAGLARLTLGRRTAWRIRLADPTAAARLGLADAGTRAAALTGALGLALAAAALGSGAAVTVPGWAPLLLALALRPALALPAAAVVIAAEAAVLRLAPPFAPAEIVGLALAAALLAVAALGAGRRP